MWGSFSFVQVLGFITLLLCISPSTRAQKQEIIRIFQDCHKQSPNFHECMRNAFNDLTVFYKTGIPELGIAPFDPHRISRLEQQRSLFPGLGYRLIFTDVAEHRWSNSNVTVFKSDAENNRFIYSQHFPEKNLDGHYNFKASILGANIHSVGEFNITLFNYSQTTTVTRIGGPGKPLKVRLEIDHFDEMRLQLSDKNNGNYTFSFEEFHPLVKPSVHELISSAFTNIFNKSFKNLDIDEFIKD